MRSRIRFTTMAAVMCVALVFAGMSFSGCGPDGPGDRLRAKDIDDGAEPFNPDQWTCPVTPWTEPIDPDIYVDYEGKRIYFGSQKAKKDWQEADSTRKRGFLANVESQGGTPEGGGKAAKGGKKRKTKK